MTQGEKGVFMKKIVGVLVMVFVGFSAGLAQAKDLSIKSGSMDFLMDAPLEDIRGKSNALSGKISVDEKDLATVKGEINMDITKMTTHTFGDEGKNKTQTGHMLNWFEVGDDVGPEAREKFKTAKLTISGAKSVEKKSDKESLVHVRGELLLHGIPQRVDMEFSVTKTGAGYQVKTAKPFSVGLVEHDIKPRDIAGKLLKKTLDALGQEVAKYAQVNVDVQFE